MPPPRPKVPPYLMMLVISFALVGLIGYQTLKDRKISGDLLLENTTLKELLKEEKKKANELQKKFTKLSTQKEELNGLKEGLSGQLIELDRAKSLTEAGKKKLESSLSEKETEVKGLRAKLVLLEEKEEQLKLMKEELLQKDTEISDLKVRLMATGKYASGKIDMETTNNSESAGKEEEGKHEREVSKDPTYSAKGFAEREREPSDENEETEGAKASSEHTGEHAKGPRKESHQQSTDNEDEESKVDDRDETLAGEENGEEADTEKTHDGEETERIREEEDTDEQPDVDVDVMNKADLDENEISAME